MKRTFSFLGSTIARKQIVALTGLGLSLFVLAHMAGNMLIFISPRAYNIYGHKLVTNPAIYLAEAGLLLIFVFHLLVAAKLTFENRAARPQSYAKSATGEKRTTWIQKTLLPQGMLILVFVILHLITFKYGTHYTVEYDGERIRDLHRLMLEVFAQPGYVVWYFIALLVLGFHLSHGVASSFQTLGFNHPRYTPKLKIISWAYAIIVAMGFISQPLYVYFLYAG